MPFHSSPEEGNCLRKRLCHKCTKSFSLCPTFPSLSLELFPLPVKVESQRATEADVSPDAEFIAFQDLANCCCR